MKKDFRFYWKLFRTTFCLSAFTFGGGFVIIPLMRRRFVEDLGWIDEAEMLDLTAIAQSSPGAIAVNASILVGYRLAGPRGALVTILGTVLPPLVILSVISSFYAAFRDSPVANALMLGMRAGVAAVITDVVLTLGGSVLRERRALPVIVMACAFLAVCRFKINIILIILTCGAVGALDALHTERRRKERGSE